MNLIDTMWKHFTKSVKIPGRSAKFVIDGDKVCPKDRHDWVQTKVAPLQAFMTFKCSRCDSRMASNRKPRALRKARTATPVVPDGEALAE